MLGNKYLQRTKLSFKIYYEIKTFFSRKKQRVYYFQIFLKRTAKVCGRQEAMSVWGKMVNLIKHCKKMTNLGVLKNKEDLNTI